MISCLSNHSASSAELSRRSEFDEDQLRWERKIRALSTQSMAAAVPAPRAQCPPTRLALTARVTRRDHLLIPRNLPALTGTEPRNLVCGDCSATIVSGLTCGTARRDHPEGSRLVIRCTCGALNLLSSADEAAK